MEIPVRSDVASGVDNQSGHRPEASRLLALLTSLPFGQSADSSQSARAPVEVAVERSAKRQAACGRTRKLIPDSGTDYISSRFLMLQELCIAELSDDQARAERPLKARPKPAISAISRAWQSPISGLCAETSTSSPFRGACLGRQKSRSELEYGRLKWLRRGLWITVLSKVGQNACPFLWRPDNSICR